MGCRTRFLFLAFIVMGCTTATKPPPFAEYTLARTALRYALQSEASKYSPIVWAKAERSYQKGELFYRKAEFEKARLEFLRAKRYAERAENKSRIKKLMGEP